MARHHAHGQSFLMRLRRDRAGNVMAMTAASLIPLIAMIGGAIDASRIYMSYTRLQQACDAGALAGRKAMANIKTLTTEEKKVATDFFDSNFPDGTYSAQGRTRAYAKGADGVVVGNASISMPTTIMKIFGYETVPLAVECQSTLNIPNTDVMFVLDVTGSMLETPNGDSQTKIAGLRQAVKDFYGALGPGAASGPGRVRYGFVPYSSNVNVGRILYAANPSFITGGSGSQEAKYQSRKAESVTEHYVESYGAETGHSYANEQVDMDWDDDDWANISGNGSYKGSPKRFQDIKEDVCTGKSKPATEETGGTYGGPSQTGSEDVAYPDSQQTIYYSSSAKGEVTEYRYKWTRTGGSKSTIGDCRLQYRTGEKTKTKKSTTTRQVNWRDRERFTGWKYQQEAFDVSAFVQKTESVANPAYWSGYYTGNNPNGDAPATFTWGGCIEEADTKNTIVAASSLTPPDDAHDLKIDLIPNSAETRWRPFLRQVQYDSDKNWLGRGPGWIDNGFAACPREASRLAQYVTDYDAATKTSKSFTGYVDSLTAVGGTYHDIGLIWGARFLSPDGIFATDNSDSKGPGGYQISRHIVFMTDGTLDTRAAANDPWGINDLDGYIAPKGSNDNRMNESHNRRTQIICNSMKAKGFTIWVIGFGISTLSTTLSECATDASHASVASNSTQLRARFATIAQTIGGLRLSQ